MENSNNITIEMENISDNEVFNYPLLILKGNKQKCDCIKTYQNHKGLLNSCDIFEINLTENKFKCIIYLNNGKNTVEIILCCQTLTITVNYVPSKREYTVCPLYIICEGHDGTYQTINNQDNSPENACVKISLITRLLQTAIAEKLFEKYNVRKTFAMQSECQVFKSKLHYSKALKMDQKELWEYFGREIMNSEIGSDEVKYLAILSCSRYNGEKYNETLRSYEELINITEGYVALGGGGLALFGSAGMHSWPNRYEDVVNQFLNCTIIDKTKLLDDSCYRGTIGACFSTSLGSILHELCHTFDLGHTTEGIMSRGFDDIYKIYTNTEEDLSSFHLQPNKSKEIHFFTKKYGNNKLDKTFFTESCLVTLHYHKWFNDFDKEKYILKYNKEVKLVTSTAGIRVIEIRDSVNEMVLKSWVFTHNVLKFNFHIQMENKNKSIKILFVEDNSGNILKQNIDG